MAASSKDIQLRELKDTSSQLKTMMSEQTELIKALRLVIDEKADKERMLREQNKLLQEQIDYLTKSFSEHPARKSDGCSRAVKSL